MIRHDMDVLEFGSCCSHMQIKQGTVSTMHTFAVCVARLQPSTSCRTEASSFGIMEMLFFWRHPEQVRSHPKFLSAVFCIGTAYEVTTRGALSHVEAEHLCVLCRRKRAKGRRHDGYCVPLSQLRSAHHGRHFFPGIRTFQVHIFCLF